MNLPLTQPPRISMDPLVQPQRISIDISSLLGDINTSCEWPEEFWHAETTKIWFLQRGYYLFGDGKSPNKDLDTEYLHHQKEPYPYAYCSPLLSDDTLCSRMTSRDTVGFGVDSQMQPIAVKFIKGESEEYECLRFIMSLDLKETRDACILPVLEFLQYDDHWFAIMPQWSPLIIHHSCKKLGNALELIHNMLKALDYLHKNKICHRDIKVGNFVSNFLPHSISNPFWLDPNYTSLLSKDRLLLAIIDFGESKKFPDHYTLQQCRLPYWESWVGTYFISDTLQGEFDYDPFAWDVGIMGHMFIEKFGHLTLLAPMLAPLFDKMNTWDIQNRFTATEALQFFEEMYPDITDEQLQVPVALDYHGKVLDRWAGLPRRFVGRWIKYREPPLPRSMKIIRAICGLHPWVHYSVAWTRKIFHSFGL